MQVFTENPKDEQSKAVKEKFTRFFTLLDEVVERHRLAKVLEDDPTARQEIEEETVMLVIPSFRLFTQKHKEFSRSVLIWFSGASLMTCLSLRQIHRNVSHVSAVALTFLTLRVFRYQTDGRGCRGTAQKSILNCRTMYDE
jgi:hypothetical protein